MIFSTLLFVLFFFSGVAFSSFCSANAAKDSIEEIQKIIGGDLSPALSSFLSEEENWNFLKDQLIIRPAGSELEKFLEKFHESAFPESVVQIVFSGDNNSKLYSSYVDTAEKLKGEPYKKFFSNCIRMLLILRDMKDPQKIAAENPAFKNAFEDAPTPIKFLTDLFGAFRKDVKAFTKKSEAETGPFEKLQEAVDKPLPAMKDPSLGLPDAFGAKYYIEEIQKIIGGDLSPSLSSFLSEEENWNFLKVQLTQLTDLEFDSKSYKIIHEFFVKFDENVVSDSIMPIMASEKSKLYISYIEISAKILFNPEASFFPKCIKMLETLRDMKDPQKIAKENPAFKKAFEDAPTPIKFLTDLFEAFKEAVKAFTIEPESKPLFEKLQGAVDKPLAALNDPYAKPKNDPTNNPQNDPTINKTNNNTSTPPNEWSNLEKVLVFGSITLVILAVISVIVFFVLRKSKSAASSA
jgi:hypothetical protein